jgi:hypothetical protein
LQIATSLQHGYAVMKTATILHARWNRMFSVYLSFSLSFYSLFVITFFNLKEEGTKKWLTSCFHRI